MSSVLHISIIDEEMRLCQDLREWLICEGHRVCCVPGHRVSLQELSTQPVDLLILGISRFTERGVALYRRIRTNRKLNHIPLIVVSEDSSLEHELLDVFDFQLRPLQRERITACLKRIQNKPSASGFEPIAAELLDEVKLFLLSHSALHFSQRNQRMLERGLQRRMLALQTSDPADYFQYLQNSAQNADELNKLLHFLTVGETCFFRYRTHREAFVKRALPALIAKNRNKQTLRIWSAGCSTGEEPYSLAILLLEHFPELMGWQLQILATDINKRALRQAREGIYNQRSVRMIEQPLLERYFDRDSALLKVKPQVRGMVHFNYLNLMADRFPDQANHTSQIDLLLCRNVLIYFQLDNIRRIVRQFSNCLADQGFLFLGHSETMQNVSDRFTRIHDHGAFFYQLKSRKSVQVKTNSVTAVSASAVTQQPEVLAVVPKTCDTAPVSQEPVPQPLPALIASRPEPQTKHDLDGLYQTAMNAFDHEQFAEAESFFDRILSFEPRHAASLVGKGLIRANQGDYQQARRFCARAIACNDLLAEAYLLRGLILDMERELERAVVEYQKVLWLDASFVMGHYLLAKALSRLNKTEQAQRSLRNTLRCLEKTADQSMIPFSGGLTRGVFIDIVLYDLNQGRREANRGAHHSSLP